MRFFASATVITVSASDAERAFSIKGATTGVAGAT